MPPEHVKRENHRQHIGRRLRPDDAEHAKNRVEQKQHGNVEHQPARHAQKQGDAPLAKGLEQIHREKWFALDADEQQRTLRSHAARDYDYSISHDIDINHYHIDSYKEYTVEFKAKLHKINAVLDTYHHDDSNSMVDYFDTNFYRNITVVAA